MKCENLGQCTSSCTRPACYCYLPKKLDTESHSQGIAPRNNIIICFMFLSSILTAALPLHPLLLLNILLLLLLLLSYMISSTFSLTSNKLSTQIVLFCLPSVQHNSKQKCWQPNGGETKRTRENLCKP